jgi:hypothetical protein
MLEDNGIANLYYNDSISFYNSSQAMGISKATATLRWCHLMATQTLQISQEEQVSLHVPEGSIIKLCSFSQFNGNGTLGTAGRKCMPMQSGANACKRGKV